MHHFHAVFIRRPEGMLLLCPIGVPNVVCPSPQRCSTKAKAALVARVNGGTKRFPRVPVRIVRNTISMSIKERGSSFGQSDIIGFYARHSQDGERHIDPLGKDPLSAYARFLQIERDNIRVREGRLPVNPPEPESDIDRSLRVCVHEFKSPG